MTNIDRQDQAIILAYHHICNLWHPTIARVSIKSFQSQLNTLVQGGFTAPTLSDFFFNHLDDVAKRNVLLTFDDALSCFYNHAFSLLLERKMKATIFSVTNFIGKKGSWDYYNRSGKCRHLNWSELKELTAMGFEIGSHSSSHSDLKSASLKKIIYELEVSKKILEDRLGVSVNFFSYPFGRFSRKAEELCLQTGYKGAVTMNPGTVNGNLFRLNRKAVYLFEDNKQFRAKLYQSDSKKEYLKLKTINNFSIGTIILNKISNP